MKVITRCVMEWDGEKYVVTEEDSFQYGGPVALCGSSNKGTNTVTQQQDPLANQYGYLADVFSGAYGLYQDPKNRYQGPFVPKVSPYTTEAQNLTVDRARAGSPLVNAAQGATLGTIQGENPVQMYRQALGGGMNGDRMGGWVKRGDSYVWEHGGLPTGGGLGVPQAGGDLLRNVYGNAGNNPAGSFYGQMASGTNANQALLGQTARGDFIGANPYLKSQFNQGAEAIREQIAPVSGHMEAFGSAPRELSERALTNLATNLYGGAYAQERANQLGAQGTLIGSQLQGAQGLGNIYQGGLNTQLAAGTGLMGGQLQAAGGVGNLYSTALGMAPGLANQDYADIARLGDIGAQQENRGREEIYGRQQAADVGWDQLFKYQQAMLGKDAGGGQTTTQPLYSNPWAGAMGGGMLGWGIGSMFGGGAGAAGGAGAGAQTGSMYGPWGALAGAGIGYLMSR